MLLRSVQKVLSPLSYESGRAERNALWAVQEVQCSKCDCAAVQSSRALKRVFYTPEGLYTRRMSLYTSQRLLTRPKGLTRDGCRLTRRSAAIMK